MKIVSVLFLIVLSIATSAHAQEVITDGKRTVTFTDDVPREQTGYDSPWQYAHAIRAGDFVYLSGMIIGVPPTYERPMGKEAFKERTADLFNYMQKRAQSAGADLSTVVKINTYHVENPDLSSLDKTEQARIIAEVKKGYVPEPHPAWTAVGTTGLFAPNGLVEIEVILYAPQEK